MTGQPYQLFIVCGPSGGGKTTVIKILRQLRPDLQVGVTYTTRPDRQEGAEDKEMRYVSAEEFKKLIDQGALIEYASFAQHWYGTAKQPLEEALHRGPVMLNLELIGAKQVKQLYPQAVTIFLHPGSLAVLEARLKTRPDYNPAAAAQRLQRAQQDWQEINWFDQQIVNPLGHPEQAAQALADLIRP